MSNKLLNSLQFSIMLVGQSEQGGTGKWFTTVADPDLAIRVGGPVIQTLR